MPELLSRKQRALLLLAGFGLLVFSGISVLYIAGFHVSPLSRDQWHMYFPYFNQGLFEAALSPQSNHRHIIPYLVFHVDMAWFGGNNHFLTAFGFFFDLLICAFLFRLLKRACPADCYTRYLIGGFILLQMLWLLNIAQLGWGFMSTMYYFAIFFYLLAVYLAWYALQSRSAGFSPVHLAMAALCGILCTFSFGIGILVWPAMLVVALYQRAPRGFIALIIGLLAINLLVFFILPGGSSVSSALTFNLYSTLAFPFKLAGGPVYFLLKSLRFLSAESCKQVALVIGSLAMAGGLLMLLLPLFRRRTFSGFDIACYALMMLGVATPMLITFSRIDMFLDPWVDRYQIWATMFWLGFIPLCLLQVSAGFIRSVIQAVILALPLVLLPSQLDLGARLAEYKVRVDNALLSYKMYIPVRQDAIDALHWNWEYKLPYFFDVLSHIREQDRNIFSDQLDEKLGVVIAVDTDLPACSVTVIDKHTVAADSLLDASLYTDETDRWMKPGPGVAAWQVMAQVENADWTHGLFLDADGKVVGLAHRVVQAPMPRGHFRFVGKRYNLYGVLAAGLPDMPFAANLLLLNEQQMCFSQLETD